MTLPDYTSAINSQINSFLTWGTMAGAVALIIGVGVGAYVITQVFSVFKK